MHQQGCKQSTAELYHSVGAPQRAKQPHVDRTLTAHARSSQRLPTARIVLKTNMTATTAQTHGRR
jgi:hypothetical protein